MRLIDRIVAVFVGVLGVLYLIDTWQGSFGIPLNFDDYEIFFVDYIREVVEESDLIAYLFTVRHGYIAPFYRFVAWLGVVLSGKINLSFVSIFFSLFWLFGFLYYGYVAIAKKLGILYALPFFLLVCVWTSTLSWTGVAYYTYIVLIPFLIFNFLREKKYTLTIILVTFYLVNVITGPLVVVLCFTYVLYQYKEGQVGKLHAIIASAVSGILALMYFSLRSGEGGIFDFDLLRIALDYLRFCGVPLYYAVSLDFRPDLLDEIAIRGGVMINLMVFLHIYWNRGEVGKHLDTLFLVLFFIGSALVLSIMRPTVLYPRYELLYFGFWAALYVFLLSICIERFRLRFVVISLIIFIPLAGVRYVRHNLIDREFAYSERFLHAVSGTASFVPGETSLGRNRGVEEYLHKSRNLGLYSFPTLFYEVSGQYSEIPDTILNADSEVNLEYYSDGEHYCLVGLRDGDELNSNLKGYDPKVAIDKVGNDVSPDLVLPLKLIYGRRLLIIDKQSFSKGRYMVGILLRGADGTIYKHETSALMVVD